MRSQLYIGVAASAVLSVFGALVTPAACQQIPPIPYHPIPNPTASEQMVWNAAVPPTSYAFVNGPNDVTLAQSPAPVNPTDTFQIALTNTTKIDQLSVQLRPVAAAISNHAIAMSHVQRVATN